MELFESREAQLSDVKEKKVARGRGCIYVHCGFYGSLYHSWTICPNPQQCLAAMIYSTNAQQESFKLISSRQTCLLQCFLMNTGSSCFSPHHLSGMPGQPELDLSKSLCLVISVINLPFFNFHFLTSIKST